MDNPSEITLAASAIPFQLSRDCFHPEVTVHGNVTVQHSIKAVFPWLCHLTLPPILLDLQNIHRPISESNDHLNPHLF